MSLSLATRTLSPTATAVAPLLHRIIERAIIDRALQPRHMAVEAFAGEIVATIVRNCPGLSSKLDVPKPTMPAIIQEVVVAEIAHDVSVARLDIMDGRIYPGTNLRV